MTDVQKYGNTVLPIGSIIIISSFRSYAKYEVVGVVENSTKTFGKEYEVYELKADRSGVKGKRQIVVFPYPNTKTINRYNVELPEPNKTLISQKEIDSDNRRLSESEVKLEWQGVKPVYLMTKDEYKKEVSPKFKEFNKFIQKNIKYFSKYGYHGIDYKDWKSFKDNYTPTKYGSAEFDFKYNRGRQYENLDIEQASDELINKLNEYLDYFKSVFGDKNIKLIESDESNSNKRSIKRAIDDGTYEKLLRDGVINYSFLKNVFDSVGLKIPTKLEKVEKEVVELGLTTDVVKNKEQDNLNFLNDLKEKFKKELNEYKDFFFRNYYTAIKNIYEYSELNKNIEYKNIDDFYVKYSEYKGVVLIPKYKYRRTFKGETEQIFIGYENLHSDTITLQNSGLRIISFNENKVVINSDWENILNKAATEYANNLFETFGNRVLLEISIINEIPKIANGYIKDLTQKGFEAYLDLVYKNGFILNIETQVIYAGGINIQVLHLRGLFKTRNAGKFVSNEELIKLYNEFNPINDLHKQEMYAKKLEDGDEKELNKISIKEEKNEDRAYQAEMLNAKKIIQKNNIKDIESLIVLTEESLKDNPEDEDLKLYLESLKDTLENLKSEKFEEGGSIKTIKNNKINNIENIVHEENYNIDYIIENNEKNKMNTFLKLINNKVFYRYYHINSTPFEVSIDNINKYGKGIYFLDNPYYYKDKFKDGMLIQIKPNLKNPKFYIEGNSVTPNADYSSDIIESLNNNIKNRNEFSDKLIKEGYDSIVAIEPRGIYLVMLYNDPDNYEIISDKKNVMAIGGEIKPLDFISESITNSIDELITKGDYTDLTLLEALFFYKAFNDVPYGKGKFLSKDGLKGVVVKKLIDSNYIDESWLVYYGESDDFEVSDNNYSPTGKGFDFINSINNRQETRIGLKDGTDLFPENANIKEYDERISINKQKLNNLINTLPKEIENKYEEGGINEPNFVVCPKCGGSGILPLYYHINAGKCFECQGKGIVPNYEAESIKKRMREARIKYEKNRIENIKKMRIREDRINQRKKDYVSNFTENLINEVLIPYVQKMEYNKHFNIDIYESIANKIGIKKAEDFINILKDYGGSLYLSSHFTLDLSKYLNDKYDYNYFSYYLSDINPFNNSEVSSNYTFYEKMDNNTKKIIEDLVNKYKKNYDKIGRYDDDIIEDRPNSNGKYEEGGILKEFNLREIKSESTDKKKVLTDSDGNLYLYELQGSKDPIWVLYNANVVSKTPYIEKGTAHRMSKIKVNIID